jgi:hypothetical protein
MDLPDDVAIRTSNHYESRLRLLNDLWGDWIKAVVDVHNQDELFRCMLDAFECFLSTTFDLLHGYYRLALANLRSAIMIGTYGNIAPKSRKYLSWKSGASELTFTPARKALLELVGSKPAGWLLEPDKIPAATFRYLCRFAHSRPETSDGDLWESNGPICSDKAVTLTFESSLQVYAICYLLVGIARPGFTMPDGSRRLFELDWLSGCSRLSAS